MKTIQNPTTSTQRKLQDPNQIITSSTSATPQFKLTLYTVTLIQGPDLKNRNIDFNLFGPSLPIEMINNIFKYISHPDIKKPTTNILIFLKICPTLPLNENDLL